MWSCGEETRRTTWIGKSLANRLRHGQGVRSRRSAADMRGACAHLALESSCRSGALRWSAALARSKIDEPARDNRGTVPPGWIEYRGRGTAGDVADNLPSEGRGRTFEPSRARQFSSSTWATFGWPSRFRRQGFGRTPGRGSVRRTAWGSDHRAPGRFIRRVGRLGISRSDGRKHIDGARRGRAVHDARVAWTSTHTDAPRP